jgi:hypothetical protein
MKLNKKAILVNPNTISGSVLPGEVIRIRNWDNRNGMLIGVVGAPLKSDPIVNTFRCVLQRRIKK